MNKFKYEDIENEIKKIFIELLQLDKKVDELDSNENLFLEEYGYSSIDALELIIMIEDAFEIAIPEEKLNTDLLESVKSLTDYVYSLLQDKQVKKMRNSLYTNFYESVKRYPDRVAICTEQKPVSYTHLDVYKRQE